MHQNPTDSADTGMVIRYSLLVISYWLLRTLGRKNRISDVLGYQLVKSGTSVGANYREANRAVSRADFTHKIGIVEKECSESLYWLELCEESDVGDNALRSQLLKEYGELLAIFTSIGKSTKARG